MVEFVAPGAVESQLVDAGVAEFGEAEVGVAVAVVQGIVAQADFVAAEQQRTIACWPGGSSVAWKEDAESALLEGPVAGQLVTIDACHFDVALISQPNVIREDWTRPDQGEYRGCEQAHSANPEIVKPHDHSFWSGPTAHRGPCFRLTGLPLPNHRRCSDSGRLISDQWPEATDVVWLETGGSTSRWTSSEERGYARR